MAVKTYPIGTKIRFLWSNRDTGKIGIIVGLQSNDVGPIIFLPTAKKHIENDWYPTLSNGIRYTWKCKWCEIEPVGEQQLEFSFMYE